MDNRVDKLSKEEQVRVVACLVEGNSLRATVRMTGIHRTTIQKLLVELGAACSAYQDKTFRNLNGKRIQCDEIWSFVYAKDKNVPEDMKGSGAGSVWTWVALDPNTKLVPCWFVSTRDAGAANHFMHDLAGRLAHRVQLTTDGHKPCLTAVEDAFGSEITRCWLRFTERNGLVKHVIAPRNGRTQGRNHWLARQGPHFNQPHGTAEFDDADADAPVHSLNKCVFQEN